MEQYNQLIELEEREQREIQANYGLQMIQDAIIMTDEQKDAVWDIIINAEIFPSVGGVSMTEYSIVGEEVVNEDPIVGEESMLFSYGFIDLENEQMLKALTEVLDENQMFALIRKYEIEKEQMEKMQIQHREQIEKSMEEAGTSSRVIQIKF